MFVVDPLFVRHVCKVSLEVVRFVLHRALVHRPGARIDKLDL